ncbi:putative ribosomal protein L14P [Rosa chinensis]|uniref:Putative ribosomal protein L14P n=1 Tax=Rosa chinensis TaxID=74649 RepID=A0A2P6PQ52_ROSCH|nr:putative ribosomal protein L14P [Rosa chinensis]
MTKRTKPRSPERTEFRYFEDNAGVIVNHKGETKGSVITGLIGKECADQSLTQNCRCYQCYHLRVIVVVFDFSYMFPVLLCYLGRPYLLILYCDGSSQLCLNFDFRHFENFVLFQFCQFLKLELCFILAWLVQAC